MKVFIPDPSSLAQEASPEKNRLRLQDYLQQAACFQLGMGKLDEIDTLIDHGYLDANTLLLDLVQQGNIRNPFENETSRRTYHQCLTYLLDDKGAKVNTKDPNGRTALHMTDDPATARLLINRLAKVSEPDLNGLTPLHLVKSVEMAKFLVEAGADIKACDRRGRPPITTAQTLEIAEYFHCAGVPFNFVGLAGHSVLDSRVTTLLYGVEQPEVAQWMIQNGVSVNPDMKIYGDYGGDTPLHDAASGEITDLLLKNGANPFAKNCYGLTALHTARTPGSVHSLVNAGLDVNANSDVGTPLFLALVADRGEVAQALLDRGAVLTKEESRKIFLELLPAVKLTPGREQVLIQLIQRGVKVKVNVQDDAGLTPLHHAQSAPLINAMVKAGASLKAKDRQGRTPLHMAVRHQQENFELVKALFAAGASLHTKDKEGKTPWDLLSEEARQELSGSPPRLGARSLLHPH